MKSFAKNLAWTFTAVAVMLCVSLLFAQQKSGIQGGPALTGRQSEVLALTLDSVLADTPIIDFSTSSSGQIIIPSGSSITTLTYNTGYDSTVTFVPLNTSAGVAVTQTVSAGKSYDLPASVIGSRLIKITVNADGAVVFITKG